MQRKLSFNYDETREDSGVAFMGNEDGWTLGNCSADHNFLIVCLREVALGQSSKLVPVRKNLLTFYMLPVPPHTPPY